MNHLIRWRTSWRKFLESWSASIIRHGFSVIFFSLAIDKVLQKLNKAKRNFRKKSNKNIRPWSNFSRISRNIARAWNKIWIKKSRRTIQNRKFSRFCWRLRSWHHGRRGHDRHALTNQSLAMTSRADFVWPFWPAEGLFDCLNAIYIYLDVELLSEMINLQTKLITVWDSNIELILKENVHILQHLHNSVYL